MEDARGTRGNNANIWPVLFKCQPHLLMSTVTANEDLATETLSE